MDSPKPHKLLMVEDELSLAEGLQMLFEMDGWQVEITDRGREAVPRIASFEPHAVLLDVSLPDMDGVEVYRNIEERWPELPVLFSSGHADPKDLSAFLERPHVGFIAKPCEYDQIRQTLGTLLNAAQQ